MTAASTWSSWSTSRRGSTQTCAPRPVPVRASVIIAPRAAGGALPAAVQGAKESDVVEERAAARMPRRCRALCDRLRRLYRLRLGLAPLQAPRLSVRGRNSTRGCCLLSALRGLRVGQSSSPSSMRRVLPWLSRRASLDVLHLFSKRCVSFRAMPVRGRAAARGRRSWGVLSDCEQPPPSALDDGPGWIVIVIVRRNRSAMLLVHTRVTSRAGCREKPGPRESARRRGSPVRVSGAVRSVF